ncbi:LGFP repeat-containing protein [Modestobacter sp. SYSU DS0290]
MRQLLVRLAAVATLVAGLVLAPTVGEAPPAPAQAADLSRFDPGNIISDAVFYDAGSMGANDVQAFLTAKGQRCTAGQMCLKNYTVATTSRSGDRLCNGYQGGAVESAATILTKVAVSCGVSPRVLLVLLQKEMGLVTATSPTTKSYERAAGYACPDDGTGKCDPAYAGLQNQLYRSAWQYKKYRADADSYSYVAGRWNTIRWSTNSSCGTSQVFIVNQATAGLYNYTPYRPNQASLNAGYGASSDPCAQYGNRNFYNYFTDWFGSTGFRVSGGIGGLYVAQGGGTGPLGAPTGEMFCGITAGGCAQFFTGGVIYWSPATGAHAVSGGILGTWRSLGWEGGPLGYPTGDMFCGITAGGCAQFFANGVIYWSPSSGAHAVSGAVLNTWKAQGWEGGPLGYPTSEMTCGMASGGCAQWFAGGAVYWTAKTGAHAVSGGILGAWGGLNWEGGPLGYPTGAMSCGITAGGCAQSFSGGVVYWSPGTGAHALSGGVLATWRAQGSEGGPLGYPTATMTCGLTAGGCAQQFAGGVIAWSPSTGARAVSGDVLASWTSLGAQDGPLGYPLAERVCGLADGGCAQQFAGGLISGSPSTGAHALSGGVLGAWQALGREAGPLGQPTAEMACGLTDGGCAQQFAGGVVAWSPSTGPHAISGAVLNTWRSLDAERGLLGYPTGDMFCGITAGGCGQFFRGGVVYWSPATGAHVVSGGILDTWRARGWEGGALGYPIAARVAVPEGWQQRFEHATLTWDTSTGTVTVTP